MLPNSSGGYEVYTRIRDFNTTLLKDLITNVSNGDTEVQKLFGGKKYFDYPKSVDLLKILIGAVKDKDALILDFFSGSATTAHATMQLNREDGGNRQYIMVQIPDGIDEKSEAYKDGYHNLCEIGKERIRLAGAEIKEADIGFRVLKLDSSNMKDIYYNPAQIQQQSLFDSTDNIKEDRTPEDLQYTVSKSEQRDVMDAMMVRESNSFYEAKSSTTILKHSETSQIKYDLIGKIAEGTVLTRKTVAAILQGISPIKFAMFKNNPEEFITKVIRLIKEQKATMIVEHISYDQIEGKYDSSIFTAEKHASFDKAYRAKKHIQDYVFTDGTAEKSVERRFAEELDGAKEVCVYAKLPKGFAIPTPVGSYSPDWAIAFYEGTVKHIYFIAETKGTMESLELRPIEKAKISCARKLFNEISTENVVYHDVDSYQNLLNIMNSIEK